MKNKSTARRRPARKTAPSRALALATGSQFVVWWLNEADYCGFQPQQEKNPLKLADYIWEEFCDRCGRPGRARLWVPDGIDIEKMDTAENDPRFEQYMDCGGIVIRAKDAPACALWGGRFTDLALNPLVFANNVLGLSADHEPS